MSQTDRRFTLRREPVRQEVRAAARTVLLHGRLEQLADDTWLLAQRSPALPADPELVRAATRLLEAQRRLPGHEPGDSLLPTGFAPGIRLHALAVALRHMQAALAPRYARSLPSPRTTGDEIDDITRLQALILKGLAESTAERLQIKLPPELAPAREPEPPPPPGAPPRPRPHVRQIRLRRENTRRRDRRTITAG